MAITVDTTQYDPARSNMVEDVAPGKCHLQMIEFEEYTSKASNCHLVRFEVQHHDDPTMIGRVHSEFISASPKSMWLLQALAVGLGMFTKDDFIAASKQQGGNEIILDFPKECGRQCFAEIRNEPYNGKDKFKIGGRFKSLTDPTASTYPINMGVIGQANITPEQIPARTQATAKPATTTASNSNGNGSKSTTPANSVADAPWV